MLQKPKARKSRAAPFAPAALQNHSSPRERVDAWFEAQGWTVWEFQDRAWRAYQEGCSGLVQVPTGAGKTYAAFLGPLMEMMTESGRDAGKEAGLHTLYITPLRAVSRDIELALKRPVQEMGLGVRVESRTGDTTSAVRARQRERLPRVLITTPESLCLLLTRENARELFEGLRCVIVDEWHDLLVSKRGSATELALARLRSWCPSLRAWAMSATIPNAEEALAVLVGVPGPQARPAVVVRADVARPVHIRSVIPSDMSRLPWAGHMGLNMLPDVIARLDPAVPTLVFTNTRSQAERWFHAIGFARPEWQGVMALHHGSIDRDERERVEAGLKSGAVRIVVATSSLDLGVDFSPVERVLQIGSPKGIARVVQRAGRANHRMGGESVVDCVPTHAMELLEVEAAREAFAVGDLEARTATPSPLDVLAQHLVTCALGGGFRADAMFAEVRTTHSFRTLSRKEFDWALELVTEGGVLRGYPQFRRVVKCADDVYRVSNPRAAQLHRLNLGTITGAESLEICYASGRRLGHIDEGFVAHLRPGQKFVFAGKVLAFVGIRDLTVICKPAPGTTTNTPLWAGTRLPITESLGAGLRRALERAADVERRRCAGERVDDATPELRAAGELIATQQRTSRVPAADELLIELTHTREGWHLFLFPFEGRLVHAGLASLLALRLSRQRSGTFSIAVNDYGLELLSTVSYPFGTLLVPESLPLFMTTEGLAEDVAESVNMTQLARLAFRDIARVAGLVMPNYPGARKTGRQLQASSGLIFDVLNEFDPPPGNLLLEQARREVLDRHFERSRMARTLERLARAKPVIVRTERLTPLSFPLVVERVASKVSSQTVLERLRAMQKEWSD
ncbi:MAG TPA: ligase-associated DNA damage response DEXH box helicase [Phycisphaerales bacterium]|nr:ligase-associated DNA damage response DEXH box helicase [Phycisphaerales bacterium]